MLKKQLLFCIRNAIPLPEVFLYVSKTNNESIESNDPLKQMALKSYLSFYTQNQISFTEDNSEDYNKQAIFKEIIRIIFQNRSILGKRLSHFIIIYDKLVKLFEEWGDNEAILDLYNIKDEYDIEFPKRKYNKKLMVGKKNTVLQILKNSIQKEECIIEVLFALQVQGDHFTLIHDERLISSLKLKSPCQILKNNVILYEQDILMGMLRLICKYKDIFSQQLSCIDVQNLFTIQNKEAQILLQEIFQKERQVEINIEQKKVKDFSSKPMEAVLRQTVIKKQFRIYIQYILENKIPIPEIILILQIPIKPTSNMLINASKEFLYEMSKLKCFEEFNKNLYISESIVQWKHSLPDLQWLEQHLNDNFPVSNQSRQLKLVAPETIIENIEITYNNRFELVDRLINVYNHTRAKWFLDQFSQRQSLFNQQCKRIGNLLLSLQDFVTRKTQPIANKDLCERIEDLKRQTNKKLFTKSISAPRASRFVDENARRVFRLLVKYGQPAPEFLRFYKLRGPDKVKSCRMQLNINPGLIQFLETNQEIQRFLIRYVTDNKLDVKYEYQLKMSDFNQNDINLDERQKQQPEQEVMINMLVLIEKFKDNFRDFLIEMFKEPAFELFYLELTDVTSYQQQKTTQLNQALNIIRRIDDSINQGKQLTIDV